MRIMGLDYGSKTVGVAMSDELLITAQVLETITRKDENKLRKTLARIKEIVEEYQVEKIVLGYPKNMNNTLGERIERTMEFKEAVEKRCNLPVILWDERLTTIAAEKSLIESNVRREHRKDYVDQIAAAFILQGYLDTLKKGEKNLCYRFHPTAICWKRNRTNISCRTWQSPTCTGTFSATTTCPWWPLTIAGRR